MIVYGHRSFEMKPAKFLGCLVERLDRTGTTPSHDEIVSVLVSVGEAEAAVADALSPQVDAELDELCGWRELTSAVASAFCASHFGETAVVAASLHRARVSAVNLLARPSPGTVRARTAEGFACYALYPEQYVDAADQLVHSMHPRSVLCLGLRSIGSVLGHVFAAALERAGTRSIVRSVRPRGHPFDRHLHLAPSLVRTIRTTPCDVVTVIDEGPGLSGSSFAAAADLLEALGIPRDRIVLVPGWNADAERLLSSRGRRAWNGHRRLVGRYDAVPEGNGLENLSGGRWRAPVLGGEEAIWPAVHPQHERPKFVDWNTKTIWRFAGLGATGRRALDRAERIADAGFGPRPIQLNRGFLQLEWIDGRPVSTPSSEFTDRVADYLSFLGSEFQTSDADDVDELAQMIEMNASEAGIRVDANRLLADMRGIAPRRIAGDSRMSLHEWIAGGETGAIKVDGLDHHTDDFFPGCRDVAWDVAGACVEGDLTPAASERLVLRYWKLSRDGEIGRRLPFYSAAYAAYRLGYTHLAADTVGSPDEATRFRILEARYADRLRRFERSA